MAKKGATAACTAHASSYMEIADGEWPAASRASIPRAKASAVQQGQQFRGSPVESPPNLNAVMDQHANMSGLPTRLRDAKCISNNKQ